ncbi:MAG: HAD hydrolase family protein [Nitrospira sp. CR1.1]|jgi:mannosyl-3-phosphoglycerate phosphatase|nr:HAD hydrolase family protein [Nitrospira sp. CR1.1]
MRRILIFSDLDGSLLDATTYSHKDATEALAAIQQRGATLILVSSKTRAEMEPLRRSLGNHHSFIVENGGAVYIPNGTFPFPLEQAIPRGDYQVVQLGTPYAQLRTALKDIRQELGSGLRGFGDLPLEEVIQLTRLSVADTRLAMQREYDEPFVIDGEGIVWQDLLAAVTMRGLRCTRGGRFYHLMGANDKGIASRRLIEWYERLAQTEGQTLVTVGLGDSLNDLPMLDVVDYPILVRKPNGSYDPEVQLPHLIRADGVGPVGWNRSLIDLLPTL